MNYSRVLTVCFLVIQYGPCHFDRASVGAKFSKFVSVEEGNESALQVAVATIGPISVVVEASQSSFQVLNVPYFYSLLSNSYSVLL